MARYEGKLEAAAEQPLALGEWLQLLADASRATPASGQARTAAIARYLGGGAEGKDDESRLGGNFADPDRQIFGS